MSNSKNHGFTTSLPFFEHNKFNYHLTYIPLSNSKSLGIHKASPQTHFPVVTPPPSKPNDTDEKLPTEAWEAFYPAGSISPSAPLPGGFSFYLSGPPSFSKALQDFPNATHVQFSYRLLLQPDWEWRKGGKLPGIFGGEGDLAYRCTGGRTRDRCQCFDIRPMWRENGIGELYVYLPPIAPNPSLLLSVPPRSISNPQNYGTSIGRGAFHFTPGTWTLLTLRIKLNDLPPSSSSSSSSPSFFDPSTCPPTSTPSNGEIHLSINTTPVISCTGLTLRLSPNSKIKGMHMQTFFGGHTPDWASPKDQRAWFADVTGVVLG
ncbi:polysaccharide lyase family 14 protein [Amanita thiersii Skay4041]|uniref:Polysaccharide lyase family 14 protein n=1 Tax=Amanita thiersii Skay4041 TaxID=703135 RepID=A0A2A9NSZ1_9AGAR|nr:polysaccharide lyase family 14 protein [Amanita thiersii Skay4041]